MEPLSVLGVAAAAVQFFEFSKNLLEDIVSLRNAQRGDAFQSVLGAAKQLSDLKNAFEYQPRLHFNKADDVSEQQKALDELFSQSATVAAELIDFLEDLRLGSQESKLEVLRRMFQTKEIVGKIRRFEGQINAYQSQLTIRLLAYMNAKFDDSSFHHYDKLAQLQRATRSGVDLPWSPFPNWLEADGICYWINGKPGSGKTTLMKFISQDSRTKSHALVWANQDQDGLLQPQNRVLQASFFFWSLSPFGLQKSQSGLLRALLHDILEQEPTLIPKVVPELCYDILKSKSLDGISEPALPELQRWFKRLLRTACPSMRLCFLIDGVDEYTGNLDELIDVLLGEPNRFVKFIISSRPTVPCTDAFSRYPSLRLQDLTQEDIRGYAKDTLTNTPDNIKDLVYPEDLSEVIEDIIERSSGVFLWVVLVAKSLYKGIKDGDSTAELLTRLRELPTDLAELYERMLNAIPPNYRFQAANLFRIMVQSTGYEVCDGRPYPVSALRMSFTEEPHVSAVSANIEAMSADEISRRCVLVNRRIRSRCCGLLEVNDRPTINTDLVSHPLAQDNAPGGNQHYARRVPFVEFIHRSVVEFFAETQVLEKLSQGKTHGMNDPRASLFGSHIRILKSIGFDRPFCSPIRDGNFFMATAADALIDALAAENSGHPLQPEFLNELDRTMRSHWDRTSAIVHPKTLTTGGSTQYHWTRMLVTTIHPTSDRNKSMSNICHHFDVLGFRGIAVLLPLPSYIRHWLRRRRESLVAKSASKVCTELLHGWALTKFKLAVHTKDRFYRSAHRKRMDLMDPRTRKEQTEKWERWERNTGDESIWKIFRTTLLLPPWTASNTKLVELLLEAGADPNRCIGDDPSTFHIFLSLTMMYLVHDEASAAQVLRLLELFVAHGVRADQVFPHNQLLDTGPFSSGGILPPQTRARNAGVWSNLGFVKFVEDYYKALAQRDEKVVILEGMQSTEDAFKSFFHREMALVS
ncbi:hypothetical protein Hte_001804 [Hypoxylon texense]